MRFRLRSAIFFSLCSVSLLSVSCGGNDGGGGGGAACDALKTYSASNLAPLSFATDIQPILMSSTTMCSVTVCHGDPGIAISKTDPNKKLLFTGPAATVRTELMGLSVNAPSMHLVTGGSVSASFLAYKISGKDGLACANSMCSSGASTGDSKPCGDPMPVTLGSLSAADRTKILDWIALGAAE